MGRTQNWHQRVKTLLKERIFPMIQPLSLIDNPDLKNRVREAGLAFRSSLPRFLMIEKGDNVVEVGTPFPSTMRELSANVGASGRVIIVEPAPENIERLRQSAHSLKFDNVTIVEKAAWDSEETLELQLASQPDDHKLDIADVEHDAEHRPANTYDQQTRVDADTVDNILGELGVPTINYATIAVNGSELKVLRGAQRTLERSSQVRLFVKGHARTEAGVPINRPIRDFLEDLGFRTRVTWVGESTAGNHPTWTRRAGNIFAYKLLTDDPEMDPTE